MLILVTIFQDQGYQVERSFVNIFLQFQSKEQGFTDLCFVWSNKVVNWISGAIWLSENQGSDVAYNYYCGIIHNLCYVAVVFRYLVGKGVVFLKRVWYISDCPQKYCKGNVVSVELMSLCHFIQKGYNQSLILIGGVAVKTLSWSNACWVMFFPSFLGQECYSNLLGNIR